VCAKPAGAGATVAHALMAAWVVSFIGAVATLLAIEVARAYLRVQT
jgi:hypothetical protein